MLFDSFSVFRFLIDERYLFDDFVLVDDYFLAKIASTALIVEFMHNFTRIACILIGEDLIEYVSEFHMSVKNIIYR